MPPKQSTLTQIHTYLQTSATAHTLKDLEKHLPASVPGLPSMLVKDHLTALADDGLILVEKIGSGNWYWSFRSAEARSKKNMLHKLDLEKKKLDEVAAEARGAVRDAQESGDGEAAAQLLARVAELREVRDGLAREIEERNCEVGVREVEEVRGRVNVLVDNLFVLEKYVLDVTGDREAVEGCRRMFGIAGLEYV